MKNSEIGENVLIEVYFTWKFMVFALNWFSGLGYGILEPSRESTSAQSKSRERKRKSLPHINFELCNLEIEKLKIR